MPRVLAIAAHPDDIEFTLAGTLMLLAAQGFEIHYFNLANGCCGSMDRSRADTAHTRLLESHAAAALIPATFHPPICDDLAIFYDAPTLAKVGTVVRRVNPSILLTHAPIDYMEDHETTSRLAVTAAFAKNMPNFECSPPVPAPQGDIAVYHAQPHGNHTPMNEPVYPDYAIDISSVIERKSQLLACHHSQQGWLDATQKMSSYTQTMYDLGSQVARMMNTEGFAEGWRQRCPLGFGPPNRDPLAEALATFVLRRPR